jgi:hypothetical protein
MTSEPFVVIRSSRVTIRGGWDHVGPGAAAFVVDDAEPDRYSEVTWDGYSFCFRVTEADKERAPDVLIRAVQPATELRFRGCSGRLLAGGQRERWAVGPLLASDDDAVQAALDAAPTAALDDGLLLLGANGWVFETTAAREEPVSPPTIERCQQTKSFPGDFPPGASFAYTVAVSAPGGGAVGSSASSGATATDPTQAIALDVTTGRRRASLRVWRGPRPGDWDSYAEVPVGAYTTRVVDTGDLLCGRPWLRGDIPIPPGS